MLHCERKVIGGGAVQQETLIKAISLARLREMQLSHLDHRNVIPGGIPGLTFCDIKLVLGGSKKRKCVIGLHFKPWHLNA